MSVVAQGLRGKPQGPEFSSNSSASDSSVQANGARARRSTPIPPRRYASDDEILGIETSPATARADARQIGADTRPADSAAESEAANSGDDENAFASAGDSAENNRTNQHLEDAFTAHPELRQAWQDAQSYREAFATPEEARAATALLADLDRMDALFFSQRPEDHAELARAVAGLDPAAFASLAKAMSRLAADEQEGHASSTPSDASARSARTGASARPDEKAAFAPGTRPAPEQAEFLHAANAAAVQGVIDAIEAQVDRLLPEGVSKSARNRVVGEIYRELDANLGSNRQLGQQIRDAFHAGNLDAAHQRAIVALVTGRARQALPAVAKRVLNEWTSTVVAANQDRLARQRAAAHRVDIAGSGRGADAGRRSLGPRDIDYARMSDSDILNL
jgi:hypothetical protein